MSYARLRDRGAKVTYRVVSLARDWFLSTESLIGELGSRLRTSHAKIAKIPTSGLILISRRYIYEEI